MIEAEGMSLDITKPMHPMECQACDHFKREIPNVSRWARQVVFGRVLLVCEMCRKDLNWAKKNCIGLNVILQ